MADSPPEKNRCLCLYDGMGGPTCDKVPIFPHEKCLLTSPPPLHGRAQGVCRAEQAANCMM